MLKVKNGGRTMIITDNIYQNTDEECQEICEFLDRLSIQIRTCCGNRAE